MKRKQSPALKKKRQEATAYARAMKQAKREATDKRLSAELGQSAQPATNQLTPRAEYEEGRREGYRRGRRIGFRASLVTLHDAIDTLVMRALDDSDYPS